MKLLTCFSLTIVFIGIAQCLPNEKVLDMTGAPKLSRSEASPRSVNLSFFIPAFSLLQLASQFMPQMFPALTTTTTSRRRQQRSLLRSGGNPPRHTPPTHPHQEQTWLENFISNGLIY